LQWRVLLVLVHAGKHAGTGMLAGRFQVNEVSQLVAHVRTMQPIHKNDRAGQDVQGSGLEEVV
jgi:hypothetical protein